MKTRHEVKRHACAAHRSECFVSTQMPHSIRLVRIVLYSHLGKVYRHVDALYELTVEHLLRIAVDVTIAKLVLCARVDKRRVCHGNHLQVGDVFAFKTREQITLISIGSAVSTGFCNVVSVRLLGQTMSLLLSREMLIRCAICAFANDLFFDFVQTES